MRSILFYNYIDDYSVPVLLEKMREASAVNQDIAIDANSGGGSVLAGIGFLSEYADYPHGKEINVHGGAGSFMAFALLWSNKNTATDMSQFLLHRAASPFTDSNSIKMVDDINKKIRRKFEEVIKTETFEKITGVTVDRFFDIGQERIDVQLTSEEARDIGLIHEIKNLAPEDITAYNQLAVEAKSNMDMFMFDEKGIKLDSNINNGIMDKQFTQSDIDKAVEKAGTTSREAETKRVSEWNKFAHVDAKAVLDGIASGKSVDVESIKKFATIEAKASMLADLEKDNPDNPDANPDDNLSAVDARAKELEDYEKDVFEALDIK